MIRLKSLLFENDLQAPGELDKAIAIVKGLQARGFSYKVAVALTGNIAHESGCEPNQTEINGTGAYGLCQWDPGAGRLKALQEFAKMTGKSVSSLETQLDFMKCELIDGYVWKGKPIPNINKKLIYTVDGDKILGLSNYYVRKYNDCLAKGDLTDVTIEMETRIFSPQPGSRDKRVANAKKIHETIKGGASPAAAKQNTSTDTTKPGSNYTTYPNPATPNASVTITVNKSILPLAAIDLKIIKTTGAQVDSHHWDNVQQGVLKFNAPSEPGVYMLQLSTGKSATDSNIKFMVQ
jgi:hypothetical protein